MEHRYVPPSVAQQRQVDDYLVSCYVNLAIVYQKVAQWQDSILACDAALAVDPTCAKALYRRAQVT